MLNSCLITYHYSRFKTKLPPQTPLEGQHSDENTPSNLIFLGPLTLTYFQVFSQYPQNYCQKTHPCHFSYPRHLFFPFDISLDCLFPPDAEIIPSKLMFDLFFVLFFLHQIHADFLIILFNSILVTEIVDFIIFYFVPMMGKILVSVFQPILSFLVFGFLRLCCFVHFIAELVERFGLFVSHNSTEFF